MFKPKPTGPLFKITLPFCDIKDPQPTNFKIAFLDRYAILFRCDEKPGLYRFGGKIAVIADSRGTPLDYYIVNSGADFGVPEEFLFPMFTERALNGILYDFWNIQRIVVFFTTLITNPSGEVMKCIRVCPDTCFKVPLAALSGNVYVQAPDDDEDGDYDDREPSDYGTDDGY